MTSDKKAKAHLWQGRRSLKTSLIGYFLIIAMLVGVVGIIGYNVASQVSGLRDVELPMEQNLREVEVSIWEMIQAANSFRLTGEDVYEELYYKQIGDVEEFFSQYADLTDTKEEQDYIDEFNALWDDAKKDGNGMIKYTNAQKNKELEFFNTIDDADDVIDFQLQTLPLTLSQEQNLREVEVSVWEAIHAVEQFTGISGKVATAVTPTEVETKFGKETFQDIYERQKGDVAHFWQQFKDNPPEGAADAIAEFDHLWAEAVLTGDEVIRLNELSEEKFIRLFENVDKADDVIDFKMQEFIEQRINNQNTKSDRSRNFMMIVTIFSFLLAIVLGLFVSRRITKPISDMSTSNKLIIAGKFKEAQKHHQQQQQQHLPTEIQELIDTRNKAIQELIGKEKIEVMNKQLKKTTTQLEKKTKFDEKRRLATISLLEDIDSQKKLLEQSEEKLRTTLHSIGDAVISTDTNSKVTYLNPVAESLTGWKLKDAQGKPLSQVFNIINEKTKKPVPNPLVKVLKEGVIVGLANHTLLISKSGKRIPVDDSGAPIKDEKGNITGAVLVFHDVTEQRENQKKIEQANEDLQKSAESLKIESLYPEMNPEPVFQLSMDGKAVDYNWSAQKLFGNVKQKDFFQVAGIPDNKVLPVVATKRELKMEVFLKQRYYELIFKKDDDIDRIFVYFKDITSIKESLSKIQRMYAELKKVDELKATFLSMTSHELKTPITPIVLQAQSLVEELQGKLNPQQRESVKMILRNVNHLNVLLSDVLDSAKLEADQLKLYPEETDIKKIIDETIEDIKFIAHTKNVLLNSTITTLPLIMVDPLRFKQVISNLLSNSIKFTPPGGNIVVSAHSGKRAIEVSVTDTGVGIEKDMLTAIFDKFVQASPSYSIKQKGTGLGLAICKGIVEKWGGKAWAESKGLHKGSTLYFTIPKSFNR